jgi:chemotaxis protein MotD
MTTNTAAPVQALGHSQKNGGTAGRQGADSGSGDNGERPFGELMAGLAGKNGGRSGSQTAEPGKTVSPGQPVSSSAVSDSTAHAKQASNRLSDPAGAVTPGNTEETLPTALTGSAGDVPEAGAAFRLPAPQQEQGPGASASDTGPQTMKGLLDAVSTQGHAPQIAVGKAASARTSGSAASAPFAAQTLTLPSNTADLFSEFKTGGDRVSDNGLRSAASPANAVTAASVKILRQETHFAPSLRLSPIQQVGPEIVSALKADQVPAGHDLAALTMKPEGQAVKALEIQLRPAELGTVKVTLKIVGDAVEVTLRTSNPDTAELLKQDRQMLDRMLRATGYKADSITIQTGDERIQTTPGQTGTSSGSSVGQEQTQANSGFGQATREGAAEKRDPEHRRSADDEQFSTEDSARNGNDEIHQPDGRSSGVYL